MLASLMTVLGRVNGRGHAWCGARTERARLREGATPQRRVDRAGRRHGAAGGVAAPAHAVDCGVRAVLAAECRKREQWAGRSADEGGLRPVGGCARPAPVAVAV